MDSMEIETLSAEDEQKRLRVVEGATRVFLAYGYRRTTMDDIAQAAEMSRPALYLVFRNKADIYRAIGERLFHSCATGVDAIMAGDEPLGPRMYRAIEEGMLTMMGMITASPHGAELLDLKNELAVGMLEHWHELVSQTFCNAIKRETAATGVNLAERGLSAEWLAEMLLDSLEGVKQRTTDPDELRCSARQLVRVVELALKP
ncbi:TetR/AcrR family transcriptional regulator [Salmonella enterica subsp. enterica]|nr:TetR/AcrR family transcriptional regulator [Salmonella enterica subsp. enterica serovar Enteritidis]MIL10119.1 TetR/AcrR family transcriptional regulator [Salmonella enterica subsp. enterica serovar Enteritidis]